MTTRFWIGPSGGWFSAASWNPTGVPAAGDEAVVQTGASIITGTVSVDDVQILLGSNIFADPARLQLNNGAIGATTTITVDRVSPYAAMELNAGAVFDGTVNVSGGQFDYIADATIAGNGGITVGRGGSVTIGGTVASAPSVSFLDDNGTLILNDPSAYSGAITGLRAGDRIELGHGFILDHVSFANDQLTLFGQGQTIIATLQVSEQAGPVSFFTMPFGHGGAAITTSQQIRTWGGSNGGDWFDAANWASGIPLGGDTVNILSGSVVLTDADALAHGTMDFENVFLGAAGNFTPVTLRAENASFGPGFNLTAVGTPQYTSGYIAPQATFVALGTTNFGGNLAAESHGGTLTVDIESDGTSAVFMLAGLPGTADADLFAEAFAGQESTLAFTGTGTLFNEGRVLVDGVAHFDSGITINGGGSIEIEAGGSVAIDGAVGPAQSVVFSDETGKLAIDNIGAFHGQVALFGAPGDRIDIGGVQASSLSYDQTTHALSLLGQGGVTLGAFEVTSSLPLAADDFALGSDQNGGSLLTYAPDTPLTIQESLPVAAVGTTGAAIPLSTLLSEAFGAVPSASGYPEYILSAPQPFMPSESYWQQGPYQPLNSAWLFNGAPITQAVTVTAADIGSYSLLVGNSIVRTAWFTVPNAESGGDISQYVRYNIWTVNPAVDAPETAYPVPDPAIPGSATRFGHVTPNDIVSSALRYNTVYNGVFNYNNCNWIADNLTAGAGAVMPFMNASTDPADNQEGGFWRIVYRGSDETDPPANWYPLTRPGDVVRMGRIDGGGQHTTTVIGTVNPDGTITVYDNGDHNSQGQNIIGIHDPTYWSGTDPASITIYRLDPAQQYLITGSGLTEYLQGSVYNDLIRPSGGADTIVGGPGDNEVQGTTAQINGITYTDFALGDSLDLTDLAPAGAGAEYDSASGLLSIESHASLVATVTLPSGLTNGFLLNADGVGGTSVTLACFAQGTRIATPSGATPVEHLSADDLVLTAKGAAERVIWMGHRHVDCARHPRPQLVLPVRIAAGAFAPGTPARDLLLSPDHSVFVDGVLIPVKYLINGSTITQLVASQVPEVTYWHVELARHDVLLAENLQVESYLDNGTRSNFINADGAVVAWPDFSTLIWEAHGCAPLHVTGPIVQAVRKRLQTRAAASRRRRAAA